MSRRPMIFLCAEIDETDITKLNCNFNEFEDCGYAVSNDDTYTIHPPNYEDIDCGFFAGDKIVVRYLLSNDWGEKVSFNELLSTRVFLIKYCASLGYDANIYITTGFG